MKKIFPQRHHAVGNFCVEGILIGKNYILDDFYALVPMRSIEDPQLVVGIYFVF